MSRIEIDESGVHRTVYDKRTLSVVVTAGAKHCDDDGPCCRYADIVDFEVSGRILVCELFAQPIKHDESGRALRSQECLDSEVGDIGRKPMVGSEVQLTGGGPLDRSVRVCVPGVPTEAKP
jgi:hypothetical protein